jgi:prefoldin subunit 5
MDELAAENNLLKSKADGLAAEATQLKTDQAKAQELIEKR